LSGTTLYAGGGFTSIGGQNRNYIAALDATTGKALAWDPNSELTISSLAVRGTTVYAGGIFSTVGKGIGHSYFAQFGNFDNNPVVQPKFSSSPQNEADLQISNVGGSYFRPRAAVKIAYILPKAEHVSLRLYSLNGQMQSELVNKRQNAGQYSLFIQRGLRLAAGAYLITFKAGNFRQEKMIVLSR
jgi:hypothetical protein